MATNVVTRQIHNVGQPFLSPQGRPMAGVTLRFTLVDEYYHAVSVFDRETKQKIVGETRVKTDAKGEFRVNLWPNTRGDKKTLYLVHSDSPGVERFASVLVEGIAPITLFDFKYLYRDVPFAEFNVLRQQLEALLSESASKAEFIVEDETQYRYTIEDMVPGTELVIFNGVVLTEGDDNDYTIDGPEIIINSEHVLTVSDKLTVRYNSMGKLKKEDLNVVLPTNQNS